MYIAGLDIGTTGCKCTVFDGDGHLLGKAYRDYPVQRAVGGHEIDISAMMDGVYAVFMEMASRYPDIGGIGVTSFGETFICVDRAGEPLHPAMLYTDPRGRKECLELVQKIGERKIAEITGLRPHEMYSISKIMWLKRNKPEVLEAAGIDEKLLSAPVPTGTIAGKLLASVAKESGLKPDTQVVSVSHDQVSAAVGAGAFDASVAVDGAGTVECLTPVYDKIPDIDVMYQGYFSVVPYVIPGKYVAYAFSYTGGALIQWCADTLAKEEKRLAKEQGISVNELLEHAYASEEPSGLLVLPHFAGAATPYMDTGSKGAVLGLTAATTVADIYRGCMEGVVYEMYLNMQALWQSGICFDRIHATGGGAWSKEWMQMKADVLDIPITSLKTVDAGTVGSAMLTGIAVGLFKDLNDAAAHMVEKTESYEPRREMHDKYMEIYKRYEKVYQVVRPLV